MGRKVSVLSLVCNFPLCVDAEMKMSLCSFVLKGFPGYGDSFHVSWQTANWLSGLRKGRVRKPISRLPNLYLN